MPDVMIIQIYEIQTPDQADLVIDAGADHIGSVVQPNESWRNEILKTTIRQIQAAGRKSSLIPLFSDPEAISHCLDYYQPDIVHFCETLPISAQDDKTLEDMIANQQLIRTRFPGLDIMRSIPIANNGSSIQVPSLALARLFEPCSDWFLTDTLLVDQADLEQPVSGYVGITGETCNWQVARELVAASNIPVILAGGIGPENAFEGVARVRPAGVDSCTRTNAVDKQGKPIRFKKDPEKVKALIKAVRAAQDQL
jgi:phosphoribosylanthranilate isomerase